MFQTEMRHHAVNKSACFNYKGIPLTILVLSQPKTVSISVIFHRRKENKQILLKHHKSYRITTHIIFTAK